MPRPLLISGTYAALARELALRLAESRRGRDLASLLAEPVSIIVPSRAAADAIVGELLALTPGGVAGVQLRTLETFALELLNANGHFPRVAGDRERRIALEAAMESAADPRFRRPSFAVMLERSYRDLRDSGVTVAQFRAAIRGFRDRELAKSAADVWAVYEAKIAAAGAVDPAAIFDEATSLAATATIAPQIVFGFYDMTGVQRRLIDRILQRGLLEAIFFPADPDPEEYRFARTFFDHFADACERRTDHPRTAAGRVAIRETPTRRDELRLVCSDVRRLLGSGVDPHSIGIVARSIDSREIPVMQQLASTFGFRVTARGGVPLRSHRVGRFLETLLTISDRDFPRADVLELIGSRASRLMFGKIELFAVERATRSNEIAGGRPEVLRRMLARVEREDDRAAIETYIDAVERLVRLTAPYQQMTSAGEWADEIAAAALMFDAEDERDLAALELVDELVALLGTSATMRRSILPRDIIRLLEQSAIRLEADDDALPEIWYGDVMSFRGRSFEYLFVYAAEQDVFPQPRSEDLLFTNEMRRKIFVREIDDGRDEERLLFQLLLDGASEIAFSFAGSSIDMRPRRPSQLLKDLAMERESSSRAAILKDFVAWVREHDVRPPLVPSQDDDRAQRILAGDFTSVTPLLASRLKLIARRGAESEYDGFLTVTTALAKQIEKKLSGISATELERYGDCPQRFLFHSIFGFEDIEEPEFQIEIEVNKKGTLYHRVLEEFYPSLTEPAYQAFAAHDGGSLPPQLAKPLAEMVDRKFVEHESRYPSPNDRIRSMEKRIAHRTIANFVFEDLGFILASGLRPIDSEYRFGTTRNGPQQHDAVPFDLPSGTIAIRGSIDRLDANAARDTFRIIDYKSGAATRLKKLAEDIPNGRNLQLALYAIVVGKIFGVKPANIDGYIRSISKPSSSNKNFCFRLGDVYETLMQTLTTYVDGISRGQFPAFPHAEKTCQYCIARLWCRTRHDDDEKRAAESLESVSQRLQPATENAS